MLVFPAGVVNTSAQAELVTSADSQTAAANKHDAPQRIHASTLQTHKNMYPPRVKNNPAVHGKSGRFIAKWPPSFPSANRLDLVRAFSAFRDNQIQR